MIKTRQQFYLYVSIVLFGAAILSHKSAVAVALGITFSLLLLRCAIAGTRNQRIWAIVAAIIVWLGPVILASRPLALGSIQAGNELTTRPTWPIGGALFADELALLVVSVAMLVVLSWLGRKGRLNLSHYAFGSVAVWSLLITLNPFFNSQTGLTGLAGRIRTLAYIQCAVIIPGLLWVAHSIRPAVSLYLSAAVLPFVVFMVISPLPLGLEGDYLARRAGLIRGLQSHAGEIDPDSFIIAAHGDQYVVTAFTGIAAGQRPPTSVRYAKRYWLLDQVKGHRAMPGSILITKDEKSSIVLVENQILGQQLEYMDGRERRLLFSINPHLSRAFGSGLPANSSIP